jgi:hypothetical protein
MELCLPSKLQNPAMIAKRVGLEPTPKSGHQYGPEREGVKRVKLAGIVVNKKQTLKTISDRLITASRQAGSFHNNLKIF